MLEIIKRCAKAVIVLALLVFPGITQAISFTPTVADVALQAGEEQVVTFQIYSDQEQTYDMRLVSIELSSAGEIAAVSSFTETWAALEQNQLALISGETASVPVYFSIPASMADQSHIIGVEIREANSNFDIGAHQAILPLVFVTVGNPAITAALTSFITEASMYSTFPVTFSYTLDARGGGILQPTGEIIIRNIFGATVETIEVNSRQQRVPGGITRTLYQAWGSGETGHGFLNGLKNEVKHLTFGIFSAELLIDQLPNQSSRIIFSIMPWRTLLVLMSIIILLIGARRLLHK